MTMKQKHWLSVGLVVLLFLAIVIGCQSRKRFSKEVAISSNPPGAEILVDGQPVGNTPLTVRMDFEINLDYPDKGLISHEVIAKKPGYKTMYKRYFHNYEPRIHFEMEQEKVEPPPQPPPPPPPPPPRQP